jgi:hypothetical protein
LGHEKSLFSLEDVGCGGKHSNGALHVRID